MSEADESIWRRNFEVPMWLKRSLGAVLALPLIAWMWMLSSAFNELEANCQKIGIGTPGFILLMAVMSFGMSLIARECYSLAKIGNFRMIYIWPGHFMSFGPFMFHSFRSNASIWVSYIAMPMIGFVLYLGAHFVERDRLRSASGSTSSG